MNKLKGGSSSIVFGVVSVLIFLMTDVRYTREEGLYVSFNRGNALPFGTQIED